MTEQQHDEHFLADLLRISGEPDTGALYAPPLTPTEEQMLLKEANQAAPPTLAPSDTATAQTAGGSFPAEVVEAIRRHPLPALLLGIGLGYMLTRRRR